MSARSNSIYSTTDSDALTVPTQSGYFASDESDDDSVIRFQQNLSDEEQGYDSEDQSPDNMLTDPEEYVVGQPEDDVDDVAEIELEDDAMKPPSADDCALSYTPSTTGCSS